MSPLKLWLLAAVLPLLTGCSVFDRHPVRYETIAANPSRNTAEARKQTDAALQLIDKEDFEAAEQKLQKALIADVSFGPAHNNLGHIYFHQGKLYLAAWEFEYATRLMPDQASPHNNLGLVYERVARLDEAIQHYRMALELSPGNVEMMANLTRARIRQGERTPETAQLLNELALRDDRPEWREWALEQLHTKHLDVLPANSFSRPTDWPLGVPIPQPLNDGSASPVPMSVPPDAEAPADQFIPPRVPPVPSEGPRLTPGDADKHRNMSRWRSTQKSTQGMASKL